MSLLRIAVLVLAVLIPLTGCEKSPEDARRELGQMGIQYTPEAFVEAAKNNDTLAIKLFLAAGMDPNAKTSAKDGATALIAAATSGHTDIVRTLLDKSADVNANVKDGSGGYTALIVAAGGGRIDIVQILLNKGADVNAKNMDGLTALIMAATGGHTGIVRALLNKGADVDVKAAVGWTALSQAREGSHAEIVKLLNQAGAKE